MKENVQISLHMLCAVLLVVCVISLFFGKVGTLVTPVCAVVVTTCFFVVIKVIQFKRKMVRTLNSCLRPERVRSSSV